jgi:hypothetical protein
MPDQTNDKCKERFRNFSCSLAHSFNHTVHVAVDSEGHVLARWVMEAVSVDEDDY